MQEQRVEARRSTIPRRRVPPRSATRFDGPSTKELEGVARVERRAEHALPELGRRQASPDARRRRRLDLAVGDACPSRARSAPGVPACARVRLGLDVGATRLPGRAAHDDLDLRRVGLFLPPQLGDQVEIVAVDPGVQESRRDREPHNALGGLGELHARRTSSNRPRSPAGPSTASLRVRKSVSASLAAAISLPLDQIHRKEKPAVGSPLDAALHFQVPGSSYLPIAAAGPPRACCPHLLVRTPPAPVPRRSPSPEAPVLRSRLSRSTAKLPVRRKRRNSNSPALYS